MTGVLPPTPNSRKRICCPSWRWRKSSYRRGGGVPAFILHKGIIRPQIHGHGCAADWTAGYQFAGDFSILLFGHHLFDNGFVIIGLLWQAWNTATGRSRPGYRTTAACQILPSGNNDPHWWLSTNSPFLAPVSKAPDKLASGRPNSD